MVDIIFLFLQISLVFHSLVLPSAGPCKDFGFYYIYLTYFVINNSLMDLYPGSMTASAGVAHMKVVKSKLDLSVVFSEISCLHGSLW